MNGVYAVTVPPDISEDPIRWLFVNEIDADAFAEALEENAVVTYEPIAESLYDRDLSEILPDAIATARALLHKAYVIGDTTTTENNLHLYGRPDPED